MTREEAEEFDDSSTRRDAVLHPTRLRIINALSPNRRLSAPQINALLRDVPQASLYRHLKTLLEAGIVQTGEGGPGRGAAEKLYRLPDQEILLTPADFTDARPEDLVRYFTTFAGILLSHGRAFYGQPDPEKRRGGSYTTDALYLTDAEAAHFDAALAGLTALARSNMPGPERRRRLLYTTILPDEE